jgi:hypothetical protein
MIRNPSGVPGGTVHVKVGVGITSVVDDAVGVPMIDTRVTGGFVEGSGSGCSTFSTSRLSTITSPIKPDPITHDLRRINTCVPEFARRIKRGNVAGSNRRCQQRCCEPITLLLIVQ